MLQRKDLKIADTWALSDIYESDAKWEEAFKRAAKKVKNIEKYKGRLGDKGVLLSCLNETYAISRELERVAEYASLKSAENSKDAKYQAYAAQSSQTFTDFSSSISFMEPELSGLEAGYIKELLTDKKFADYDYMLKEVIRGKAHILSEREERLLSEAHGVTGEFYEVFSMLDNADLKFGKITGADGKKVELTHGVYGLLMQGKDRGVRERAFKQYYSVFEGFINTLAASFNGNIKKDWFYAKARGFKSCLTKALFDEHVEPKVYENLLAAVEQNIGLLHRYMELRKKELNYDELHMYDLSVPVVKDADVSLEYAEATELVRAALLPLGEEYGQLLDQSFSQRWIDVFETEGKRSGAFCSGCHGVHPFVLLNYQKTTHDIFTIAHELGHAMHSYYSDKYQPYVKSHYRIFVAEVASTVNEVLLLKHMLATEKNKGVKKYLLTYYLDMFKNTLFRQTMFAEFEYIAHTMAEQNEPLTNEALSARYYALNKKYYGVAVVHDEQIKIEWARVPHFYYNFYVYKYATGLTAAVTIAENILNDKTGKSLKNYQGFLKSGGGDSPVELLKIAGVDLTDGAAFATAMKSFEAALDELEGIS